MMKRLFIACALFAALSAMAIMPPTPDEMAAYKKDGSYAKRLDFAKNLGKNRVRPDVAQRTIARLNTLLGLPKGIAPAPLPSWQGMPTKGTNNLLVFLVDFPDYPHVNDASVISNKLFGVGNPSEFPLESLRNFYRRSSFDQLELQGNALGWYRMQHNRSWYTSTYPEQLEANRAIIQEIIANYDSTHDFSQYDNNHDGFVDYFAVIWAGPDNGWANFWWGYQWDLDDPVTADGVQFKSFSWQWESRPVGSAFDATIIIHETGHALGLPDYYDYDSSIGPDGGVGGLDMMDGAFADHNGFSKFMLEWIRPAVVPSGLSNITLVAQSQFSNMVAVMPGYNGGSPYTEFFFAENRYRTNNDSHSPGDGILIWHVDATPDSTGRDFEYNNSYTSHKLLRLMEADGLEQIETGSGIANAGDYYTQGNSFWDESVPNSWSYAQTNTYAKIDVTSANGPTMTLSASIQATAPGARIVAKPSTFTANVMAGNSPPNANLNIAATGGTMGYAIAKDAPWLSVTPASGSSSGGTNAHTITFSAAGLEPGLYSASITISSPDAVNSPQTIPVNLTVMGNNIGHAVNATNLAWNSGGSSLWFEQYTISQDGVAAAQSGMIGDLQTNWIQTTVTGPGLLSFWWKVSSEQNWDYLRFYIDDVERSGSISGTIDWQYKTYVIVDGVHTVKWAYTKDRSVSSGADAGWVDQVSFVHSNVPPAIACSPNAITAYGMSGQNAHSQLLEVWNDGAGSMSYSISDDATWLTVSPATEISTGPHNQHTISFSSSGLTAGNYNATITITAAGETVTSTNIPVTLRVASSSSLAQAVDFTNGVWSTGGDVPWTLVSTPSHDGEDATQSGVITDHQSSWIKLEVQGPGILSYWTKVSTEEIYDCLHTLLDDEYPGVNYSGELDWQEGWVDIPPGSHTITWNYQKDVSIASGQDAVWLDQVRFISTAPRETVLFENFDANTRPNGWNLWDNLSWGALWVFNNPLGRSNYTGGANGFAIADSEWDYFYNMDTELWTPRMNLVNYTNVLLEFKTAYLPNNDVASVDLSTDNGSTWSNLWFPSNRYSGALSFYLPQAAGQSDVIVRFRYIALLDDFWELDDVKVTAESVFAPGGMVAQWRQAWDDFDRNYSYFTLKGIDWAPVYDAYTNTFAQIHDPAAFAAQLNNVLQTLHDWQVFVREPNNGWLGYNGAVTTNFSTQFYTNYTGNNAFHDVRGLHALYHQWVGGSNFGYIIVSNLNAGVFTNITDADLDAVFQNYSSARAIILDLRRTVGGDIVQAERLASHFTDLPRTYGYTRTRLPGTDHNAFGPYSARILNPSTGPRFTNQTACLIGENMMSTAEWLALMMKSCPQTVLFGDHTRGATANAAEFFQTNINVSYTIPRWIGYSADMVPFEAVGIAPQVAIAPGASSFNDSLQRDYVLERAMLWLNEPKLTLTTTAPNNPVISWPAASGYQYTLLRTTNLVQGPWTLAPGWTSNRIAVPMIYTNSQPQPYEFYRIEITPIP